MSIQQRQRASAASHLLRSLLTVSSTASESAASTSTWFEWTPPLRSCGRAVAARPRRAREEEGKRLAPSVARSRGILE
eukprot:scaffold291253_cov31-Tisochrysis_lutea.AAC.7